MTARLTRSLRLAALVATTGVVTVVAGSPAHAAGGGDVDVVNTETVQVYTSPSGEVQDKRVYEQLALSGEGPVTLDNPISTDHLRNLDGFSSVDVENGEQVTSTTVHGQKRLRSVSDYDRTLPLDVSVSYRLDGHHVEPGELVGKSGNLEVEYVVENVTGTRQRVSYPDGKGGTVTKSVMVPVPMVGTLTTVAPPSFTDVRSHQANIAGDGKGGTQLSFTMTLFPPIGSTTADFGYTARISDGVVPRATVSALPVNPLASPTFKSAGASYKGGADTGAELAAGATTIDTNLLKLRDGASTLLAGLLKLRAGADQLNAGLAGDAAPGAHRLADGAGDLSDGLEKIDKGTSTLAVGSGKALDGSTQLRDGAARLADGTGTAAAGGDRLSAGAAKLAGGAAQASAGSRKLAGGAATARDGSADLASGLGDLSTGATTLDGGVQQLKAGSGALSTAFNNPDGADLVKGSTSLVQGLTLIQGGLAQLDGQLPGAQQGLTQLKAGVDSIVAALGADDQAGTLIGGMKQVDDGLASAQTGAGNLSAGAATLASSLPAAQGGVDQVASGLGWRRRPARQPLRGDHLGAGNRRLPERPGLRRHADRSARPGPWLQDAARAGVRGAGSGLDRPRLCGRRGERPQGRRRPARQAASPSSRAARVRCSAVCSSSGPRCRGSWSPVCRRSPTASPPPWAPCPSSAPAPPPRSPGPRRSTWGSRRRVPGPGPSTPDSVRPPSARPSSTRAPRRLPPAATTSPPAW